MSMTRSVLTPTDFPSCVRAKRVLLFMSAPRSVAKPASAPSSQRAPPLQLVLDQVGAVRQLDECVGAAAIRCLAGYGDADGRSPRLYVRAHAVDYGIRVVSIHVQHPDGKDVPDPAVFSTALFYRAPGARGSRGTSGLPPMSRTGTVLVLVGSLLRRFKVISCFALKVMAAHLLLRFAHQVPVGIPAWL